MMIMTAPRNISTDSRRAGLEVSATTAGASAFATIGTRVMTTLDILENSGCGVGAFRYESRWRRASQQDGRWDNVARGFRQFTPGLVPLCSPKTLAHDVTSGYVFGVNSKSC